MMSDLTIRFAWLGIPSELHPHNPTSILFPYVSTYTGSTVTLQNVPQDEAYRLASILRSMKKIWDVWVEPSKA